jgi:two-component system, cell cycle sensor histidine kinase and response regulator CckA
VTSRPPSAEDSARENEALRQENETLRRRLVEAEQMNEALTNGEIDAVVDAVHQVPLLLRQAEALRASEERYRVLFDASTDTIITTDEDGRIAGWNKSAERMFGYAAAEVIGQPATVVVPHGYRDRHRAGLDRVKSGGEPHLIGKTVEMEGLRRDGSEFPLEVSLTAWTVASGRFYTAIIRDITERRLAEEQVERIHSEYRLLLNSIGEGVHWIGVDGRIRFENPAAAGMLGYEVSELIGKPAHLTMHHTRADGTPYPVEECAIYAALRDGVACHAKDDVFWRKDGTSFAVEYISTPIRDEKDRLTGTVVVFTDITDRRRLEEQLRQSQKMEAVGRLAGGVAHDFNNLLTVIFGYSDVLLHGLEPGPLYEAMQEVRRASERAAGLTRQLLAFSRKQTLVPEVLDLGDVVSSLSTMVERLIGEDVKVSVVVSPGLGWVKADRGQLEQVVMNLTVNARDAMPKGGSLLFELQNVELDDAYTATHAEVKPGPYVLLAISDTGTGMDAKTQKRIFEPFFTTKEVGKGTGLGLSTVHGIVHQSGGAIDVYSKPGRGTTFKVYLPRFADDAAVPRAVSEIHAALAAESETVLVVEDEAAIRQLTKLILQKAGYTVLLAESPVAAERIAGSHPGPIHLMLADVAMPGMRGPKLAEQLIRLRPDLRVLYMSGYTDNAIAHHGILDAGTEFLQKPFTPLRLRQKIREVLGRSER